MVLKVLNGPLASMGEQVHRGPVVRLGANPGPGGVSLTNYRGLDARQCVITAYTGGTAAVAPVGTNQVRLAPHANVNWKDIDPINGPEYMSPGAAMHLGPIGRGATVEFVECRRLGVWQRGRLASEAADVPGSEGGTALPAAYDARRVGRIQSSTAPYWFVGCSFLLSMSTIAALFVTGVWVYSIDPVASLGPVQPGVEFYESVDLEEVPIDPGLLKGLEQPYYTFVMEPNIRAAGNRAKGWETPDMWDQAFYRYVSASVEQHVSSWRFFERLDAVQIEYAKVTLALRAAGLPEVFAGIPYQESRYQASITSEVCAEGYWQFMPETAYRVAQQSDLTFRVRDCTFLGSREVAWSPSELAPPPVVRVNGAYMDAGVCQIEKCLVDDRQDLERSTAAAILTLAEAWNDPLLAASGSAVQLTALSHNAGYDDSRFGKKYAKRFNVLPAYKRFIAGTGEDQGLYFAGQNIRCRNHTDKSACQGQLMAETQHYAYSVVAQHFLAVCYYAKNYGEDRAFTQWRFFTSSEGYCTQFKIPTRDEVRARRSSGPS